ncbi:hypothetical protein [Sutcliffiella cohnii]|uniref:hypothetical protein n=1 Tax=Sutcliffiella cohnii TaxID=33932 RepID=UPI002E1F6B18|nr:hypothetical protein [Sutcliffiella cohnii]
MKLEDLDLTLEDYLLERNLYIRISESQLEEYTNNEEQYIVIKVTGNSTMFADDTYVVYMNNGSCYFSEGDNLGDCKLDDPSFFEGLRILGDIDDEDFSITDCYFSKDYDACRWEADYDGANIAYEFKINARNDNGIADLYGIFVVDK